MKFIYDNLLTMVELIHVSEQLTLYFLHNRLLLISYNQDY